MTDHVMLARVFALVTEADVIKADLEGMKIDTATRFRDNLPLNYEASAFEAKANELRGIVSALNSIGY